MADLKNSKTAANLAYAFAGESQARNKYTYFASVARKEGYEQIAAIFEQTANNEKEHAKLWFKELGGLGDTMANLTAAAAGEHEEWTEMYKNFAKEAAEEGFDSIARAFERVLVGRGETAQLEPLLAQLRRGRPGHVFDVAFVEVLTDLRYFRQLDVFNELSDVKVERCIRGVTVSFKAHLFDNDMVEVLAIV